MRRMSALMAVTSIMSRRLDGKILEFCVCEPDRKPFVSSESVSVSGEEERVETALYWNLERKLIVMFGKTKNH